jgi:predicted secreted protein
MPEAGRIVLIKIDIDGVGGSSANWTTVAQQRGGGLGRNSEMADATHKDDSGWSSAINTRKGWSVSADGALDATDSAYQYLLAQWEAQTRVYVQVDESSLSSGVNREGQAWIADLSEDFPEGDVVSYTLELQGDAALSASP